MLNKILHIISVSVPKPAAGGLGITGAVAAAQQSGWLDMLSENSKAIASMCTMFGVILTTVSIGAAIFFQWKKHQREEREHLEKFSDKDA